MWVEADPVDEELQGDVPVASDEMMVRETHVTFGLEGVRCRRAKEELGNIRHDPKGRHHERGETEMGALGRHVPLSMDLASAA